MYTAGGKDALIDGIVGTTNWKTGEWQSYFDKDFVAVIDLKKVRQVKEVGIHVLQDVSPWIVYPSEVIFEESKDGKTYYRLEKGEIVETGSHTSLLQEKGLYYAMWRQQIGERKTGTTTVPEQSLKVTDQKQTVSQ